MRSLSLTARLARSSALNPWRTVIIWVVALLAAIAIQIVAPLDSTTEVNLLNNPESNRGWDLLAQHGIRQQRTGTETVIVHSDTVTVDDPTFQQTVQQVTDAVLANTKIVAGATNFYELNAQDPNAAARLVSTDRMTTIIPVTLTGSLDEAADHGSGIHGSHPRSARLIERI